jgi:hypothetical protein
LGYLRIIFVVSNVIDSADVPKKLISFYPLIRARMELFNGKKKNFKSLFMNTIFSITFRNIIGNRDRVKTYVLYEYTIMKP